MVRSRKPKHVPVRTCVVCQSKDAKRGLTRLVRTEQGILVDTTGKVNGRGAYLCDNEMCWQRAMTTNVLEKALKTTLKPADRERLQAVSHRERT